MLAGKELTTFGQEVRAALARRRVTFARFSADVGVSSGHLGAVLTGRVRLTQQLQARVESALAKLSEAPCSAKG